jgi:hypothetical protein
MGGIGGLTQSAAGEEGAGEARLGLQSANTDGPAVPVAVEADVIPRRRTEDLAGLMGRNAFEAFSLFDFACDLERFIVTTKFSDEVTFAGTLANPFSQY